MNVCILDTETTGLPDVAGTDLSLQPQVIEACLVIYDESGKEIEELSEQYNPGIQLPYKITQITGITDEDLKDKGKFDKEAYFRVQEILAKSEAVVAHNLPFDMDMLNFEAQRLSTNFLWPKNKICTAEQSEGITGRRMRLIHLYEFLFEKPLHQTHRAKDDVEALAKCYFELVKRDLI